MVSVKQKKKGEGWIVGRQALHNDGIGIKINLFVAFAVYKFCRAMLYTGAKLNDEVTGVLQEMEVHLIHINILCWVSCDTSLCCEDVFFEAEVTLSTVSPV